VAGTVAEAVERLERSVGQLAGEMEVAHDPAQLTGARPVAPADAGVTLRQVMAVQRQFINTLDSRLACLTPSAMRGAR
jgi:hypothetical protein